MKFKNTQNVILPLNVRDSVYPFSITRDFSDKEIEELPGIQQAVKRGILVAYDGPDEQFAPVVAPRKASWDVEMSSGTTVKKTMPNGAVVEYVVSDTEGSDSVAMHDPDTVTALAGRKSSDYIEEGVSAAEFNKTNKTPRNASQAYDEQIDKENAESAFDDEENLAESENDQDGVLDVDDEIRKDATQMLVKNGRAGSTMQDVLSIVQKETTQALNDISAATRPSYDDGELQAGAPGEIVSFLKQNFSSKKWTLSKTEDSAFLENVIKVTKSENIKTLAEQRLSELKQAK